MEQKFSQNQVQTQGQVQTQVMTPQQLLLVKLTEMSVNELESCVEKELYENSALEESPSGETETSSKEENYAEEDSSSEESPEAYMEKEYDERRQDYANDDDVPDNLLPSSFDNKEQIFIPYGEHISFYEKLKGQIGEHDVTERQRTILEYLIGSLDSDGLLRKNLDAISYEMTLNEDMDVSVDELGEALRILQTFDPAGIAATSLQECLLLQLQHLPVTDENTRIATQVVRSHFDDFVKKRYNRIRQIYDLDDDGLRNVLNVLCHLNPRPGSALSDSVEGNSAPLVIPDFTVTRDDDGSFSITLNQGDVPTLRISNSFRESLTEYARNKKNLSKQQKEAAMYMKQKVDAAQSFINAIMQRRDTLMRTMTAIVDLQKPYFEEGDPDLLQPMILEDVAKKTGLDKSTISRVSKNKYVSTDYGVLPIKYFFNERFVTSEGDNLSKVQIKNKMQEIINGEDKSNPLSDDDIAAVLKHSGFPVARRTVAKYREKMKIPVARLRKA